MAAKTSPENIYKDKEWLSINGVILASVSRVCTVLYSVSGIQQNAVLFRWCLYMQFARPKASVVRRMANVYHCHGDVMELSSV